MTTPITDDAFDTFDRRGCGIVYIRQRMAAIETELTAANARVAELEAFHSRVYHWCEKRVVTAGVTENADLIEVMCGISERYLDKIESRDARIAELEKERDAYRSARDEAQKYSIPPSTTNQKGAKMTPPLNDSQKQTIRIALAKWEGFTNVEFYEDNAGPGMWVGDPPKDRPLHLGRPNRHIPNYPASLDACHAIEVKLTDEQFCRYQRTLRDIVGGCGTHWHRPIISASAEHRALALFRALNMGELVE